MGNSERVEDAWYIKAAVERLIRERDEAGQTLALVEAILSRIADEHHSYHSRQALETVRGALAELEGQGE